MEIYFLQLTDYRDQIDKIDDQILGLLQKRAEISKQIGEAKAKADVRRVYAPDRQKNLIERLKAQNKRKLPEAALEDIWTTILSVSRSLQGPERIAFLGPEGSFGHMASLHHFGKSSTEMIPIPVQIDIFTEVESGSADYGVVAIENSGEGIVDEVLERFRHTSLKICAEIFQPIRHHLLSKSPLPEIQCVYSHRQAFAQCRDWLSQNLGTAQQTPVVSTSEAARLASQEPNTAAIASELASELYKTPIVANSIMDKPKNTTRFLVIGNNNDKVKQSGDDQTSLFFTVQHKVGALRKVLSIFEEAHLNLNHIESLPARSEKSWEYLFFVEAEGHADDKRVKMALDQLKELCPDVNVLGSYPRGTL